MKTLKVLVVDDDNADRIYYQRILKQSLDLSHQILEAETGKSALALLRAQKVDCILINYHLPDTDGIQLIADIKKIVGQFIPIIMLTGKGDENVVNSLKLSAIDCIMKNKIQPQYLVALMKNLIRNFYLARIIEDQKNQIEKFAFYDLLTGLLAFQTFYQILKHSIAEALRFNHQVGLIYIDIDNFFVINDSLGHLAGDEILIEISNRLKTLLPEDAIISRAGRDEFIILITGLEIEKAMLKIAQGIQVSLRRPFSLVVEKVSLTVSMGVSCLRNSFISADELLKNAEKAMSIAQQQGGNCIYLFIPTL